MCRKLFLNQSLEAGAGNKSAGITMSKHIADLLPPTANLLLLLKLIECDECSPALTVIYPLLHLLLTFSPSFGVVFSLLILLLPLVHAYVFLSPCTLS